MPRFPFAEAARLLVNERTRSRYLHRARNNDVNPYELLRGLR